MRAAYAKAKDLLSEAEFEARVRAKRGEWGGLLDEDAAARLVLDDLGRGELNVQAVRELREGMEITLRVRVDAITTVREFHRQDGSAGRGGGRGGQRADPLASQGRDHPQDHRGLLARVRVGSN